MTWYYTWLYSHCCMCSVQATEGSVVSVFIHCLGYGLRAAQVAPLVQPFTTFPVTVQQAGQYVMQN